jgi:hypothetical protein
VQGKSWLSRRVVAEAKIRGRFIDAGASDPAAAIATSGKQGLAWRRKEIQKYGRVMRTFRQHLAVLVHITGGLPARGTEVITVQH